MLTALCLLALDLAPARWQGPGVLHANSVSPRGASMPGSCLADTSCTALPCLRPAAPVLWRMQRAEPAVPCSLEEVAQPEAREGKYAAVDLRRLALVLERYRELERGSGFAGMHKSRQSERFISRKTVDAVVQQLREATGMGRKGSRISTRTSTERPA